MVSFDVTLHVLKVSDKTKIIHERNFVCFDAEIEGSNTPILLMVEESLLQNKPIREGSYVKCGKACLTNYDKTYKSKLLAIRAVNYDVVESEPYASNQVVVTHGRLKKNQADGFSTVGLPPTLVYRAQLNITNEVDRVFSLKLDAYKAVGTALSNEEDDTYMNVTGYLKYDSERGSYKLKVLSYKRT